MSHGKSENLNDLQRRKQLVAQILHSTSTSTVSRWLEELLKEINLKLSFGEDFTGGWATKNEELWRKLVHYKVHRC